jgi:hypothetical protein
MNHTRRRPVTFLLAFALSLAALTSCANARTDTDGTKAAVGARPTLAQLHEGVVSAVDANHELSVQVLWTNRIPSTAPRSTRGPALAAMRAAAVQRQKQRVRVRMLHQTFRIVSIRFSASRGSATAVVLWNQDVAPSHLDGVRIGRAIAGRERASILLHRIGSSSTFVVWKVDLIK